MKIYCYQCGAGINYTSEKPNFCMKCGCALNSTKAEKPAPPPAVQEVEAELEDEQIDPEIVQIPSIRALEADIDVSEGPKLKLGDIAGTNQSQPTADDGWVEPKGQKVSQKQFLEDFQREAGTTRKKPD